MLTPPTKTYKVKMSAKKSKPDLFTVEKIIKFFPFILGAAKARFTCLISNKKVVRERALNWKDDQGDSEIKDLVQALEWQKFCDSPREANLPLVKEFYANMKGMKQGKVFVRGIWITFDGEEINFVIGCPNHKDDEFVKMMIEEVNIAK